tara:strand:- start:851 stop:1483 length:633 start_codon:yes stop_codon:yes gene_type:complete
MNIFKINAKNTQKNLHNKKILFYGPGPTLDKPELNINTYDYIFITNNMITIFFDKYDISDNQKIIMLCNQLYCLNYYNNLIKYENKIDIFLFINILSVNKIKNVLNNQKIALITNMNYIKKTPLGLTRILNFLENIDFKKLYITGVTFYRETNIDKCYEDNYIVNEGKKFNIFKRDKHVHDMPANINYTKQICSKNKNITYCDEMKKIFI